jgi:hypothetical protein
VRNRIRHTNLTAVLLALILLIATSAQLLTAQSPPIVSITNVVLPEGDTGTTTQFQFTVIREGDIANDTQVEFETLPGTINPATEGVDYTPASGTLIFLAGNPDAQIITVDVIGDDDPEPDEFFLVRIFNPSNATINQDTAQGIIQDDDTVTPGQVILNRTSVSLTESSSNNSATVRFTLNVQPTSPVTITITQDADCTASPLTVTLNASNWDTGTALTIRAVNDSLVEGNHTCTVTTNPAASADSRFNGVNPPDITGNITDNDGNPTNTPTRGPSPTPGPSPTLTPVPPTVTPIPTATPIPRVASVSNTVEGLAVRTGPYLGATLNGVAVPGFEYNILAKNTDEGGEYPWYLIQVNESVSGWVSGRLLNFPPGLDGLLGYQGSIFDTLDGAPDIGVFGTTLSITDMRRRPSGRSQIVLTIPANAQVSIVGRTRQNGGDFWYQVRYNGQIGWIPAFIERGQTHTVPIR